MWLGVVFIVAVLLLTVRSEERCPPIFGAFSCPRNFICRDGDCFHVHTNITATNCEQADCDGDAMTCVGGRCFPSSGLPCNRHTLVGDGLARSIVSDCGPKASCVNGRCTPDRCLGVACETGSLCRDGECVRLVGAFCLGDADCGPFLECEANRCREPSPLAVCNCDPTELCVAGQCFPNQKCATIACEEGFYCAEGRCIKSDGGGCQAGACQGGAVCLDGVCHVDPCKNRCPTDHDCRRGQCRHLQGLLCHAECPKPYVCVDGRCTRNDCALHVCQIGEICEGPAGCTKAEGRFCTSLKDCPHAYVCADSKCHDTITPSVGKRFFALAAPRRNIRLP